MYNDTVTIFNRRGDMWYPTTLHGVDFNGDKASINAHYGYESSDAAKLHIRYKMTEEGMVVDDHIFLKPKEYADLFNPAGYFTLAAGEGFSFFTVGEFADGEISDDDYMTGFYDYMNNNRDDVYAVTSVAVYSVIPHIEVVGK